MGQYYYLMTMLPPAPDALGEGMPLGFGEITALVKRNVLAEHAELVFAHLHAVDAFNWEQADQGRSLFREGGLLSREELAGAGRLPDFIGRFKEEQERGIHLEYPYDRLWELYYSYALDTAERFGSRFLVDFLGWEVDLRSGLLAERVREAGGNLDDHSILKTRRPRDLSDLLERLKAQRNPLQAERFLDEERLRRVYLCEGVHGFSIDALLAYITRMEIYSRWERMNEDLDVEAFLWHGGTK